jgi:hypothetical protein
MGLALASVSQPLSNRRMCAIGQAPRALGPFTPGFLRVILSGTDLSLLVQLFIFTGLLVCCRSFLL